MFFHKNKRIFQLNKIYQIFQISHPRPCQKWYQNIFTQLEKSKSTQIFDSFVVQQNVCISSVISSIYCSCQRRQRWWKLEDKWIKIKNHVKWWLTAIQANVFRQTFTFFYIVLFSMLYSIFLKISCHICRSIFHFNLFHERICDKQNWRIVAFPKIDYSKSESWTS